MGLTNKQRAFVEYYLQTWNASEAARLAGYSERTARNIGSENLTKPDIKAEIEARLSELTMSSNEVLMRLTEQARAAYSPYIGTSWGIGHVNLAKIVEDGKAHLIKGIRYDREGRPVVEFYDAQAALVQLGRHYKLFSDNVDLTSGGEKLPGAQVIITIPDNGRGDNGSDSPTD